MRQRPGNRVDQSQEAGGIGGSIVLNILLDIRIRKDSGAEKKRQCWKYREEMC